MRTLDPVPVNYIANAREVRPWLGYQDRTAPVDLTPVVRNPHNYTFVTENGDGCYIVIRIGEGLYEAHSMACHPARGAPMANLMRRGFEFMFTQTDCLEITTTVPDGNRGAARWADLAGFRKLYRREKFFPAPEDMTVGAWFYTMTYLDWAVDNPRAGNAGRDFHDVLEAYRTESHPDDHIHDQIVGATLMCARAGNLVKGITQYNRWAAASGYMQSHILSVNPPLVDIGDAVLSLADGDIDVLYVKRPQPPLS